MEDPKQGVWRQVMAAFGICYLCFSTGNMLGFTSPSIPSMRNDNPGNNSFLSNLFTFYKVKNEELAGLPNLSEFANLTDSEASWIGGLCPLGAIIGSFIATVPAKLLGPKSTIQKLAFPIFLSSWILLAIAPNLLLVYIGRLLGGISIGICTSLSPVYVVEMASVKLRGPLGTLPQSLLTTGILGSYILGTFVEWRQIALICGITMLPAFYILQQIPESPAYLFSKNRYKEAERSLQYFHGSSASISEECESIHCNNNKIQPKNILTRNDIGHKSKNYFTPIAISFALMGFQQFCGINAINFYAVSIFASTGGENIDPHLASIIVAFFLALTTYSSFYLIERLGRKILLILSIFLMGIADFALGTFFYMATDSSSFKESFSWLPLSALVIFVLGFSIGYGPITFIIVAEIIPKDIRTTVTSISVGFNWLCVFGVAKTYPCLIQMLCNYGTFWLYGILASIGLVFTMCFVPETKGKTDAEIQEHFSRNTSKQVRLMNEKELTVCMS